ncbi:metallophosphoesterase [Bacillus changyiensis]|uniref:metallophosphoesterase n=1 Tax=Bacillus changyiensis TaxID=3004103 RepID=UPI0022E889D2|nr:metallophosphoesterase [Bacillus changyiensis]MDA1475348.1 metallophosphoesterase [Bacillus changyiensis]
MIYLICFCMIVLIGLSVLIWKMSIIAKEDHIIKNVFSVDRLTGTKTLNIFFISDIHRRKIHDNIIAKVKDHRVDLVLIGGDLAEQGVPITRIEENIKKLASLGRIYFVWGNNDYEIDQQLLSHIFKTYHVTALRNQSVIYEHDGQVVNIIGVDDIRLELDDYPKALQDSRRGALSLLLSHNPAIHHQIEDKDGIDIILSGHTHGGQIRIGRFGFYEKGGTGTINQAQYLISNGYGTTRLPLRLGARPETHLIQLVPKVADLSNRSLF